MKLEQTRLSDNKPLDSLQNPQSTTSWANAHQFDPFSAGDVPSKRRDKATISARNKSIFDSMASTVPGTFGSGALAKPRPRSHPRPREPSTPRPRPRPQPRPREPPRPLPPDALSNPGTPDPEQSPIPRPDRDPSPHGPVRSPLGMPAFLSIWRIIAGSWLAPQIKQDRPTHGTPRSCETNPHLYEGLDST